MISISLHKDKKHHTCQMPALGFFTETEGETVLVETDEPLSTKEPIPCS